MKHLHVELRAPWRRYQGKTREGSLLLRVHARGRWRWLKLAATSPWHNAGDRSVVSVTVEAKTWLTDEGMRGNLTRKTFARFGFKIGLGGRVIVRPGRCTAFSDRGNPCTWQRGHVPMIVRWHHPGRRANQGDSEFAHSYLVPRDALRQGECIQEPRRPRPA